MKTIFIILGLLCLTVKVFAQYDDKFYYPSKGWDEKALPPHEEIYFYPEQDTIHSIFCKPQGAAIATVFYIHGNSGNISDTSPFINTLLKSGFQVFIADFRGYGKSSGKPTHVNIASDGQTVLNYLLERPDVKNKKLILYGASIGSQLATKLAKENQNEIDALVLEGGINSFLDMALLHVPEAQQEVVKKYLIFPYSSKEDIAAISNMPKLIIHSTEDKVVPFSMGEEVFRNAREPKIFLSCKGEHIRALQTEPNTVISSMKSLLK